MMDRKLKLGLMLDSYEVPAWAYESVNRIVESGCAVFSLIVLNDPKGTTDKSSLRRLWEDRKYVVYSAFCKMDEQLFTRTPDPFESKDLRSLLPDVPVIPVHTDVTAKTDDLNPVDIGKIRQYGMDILIKLGFRDLEGDILSASRYGIWGYKHGDDQAIRGGPPGFWEVVLGIPETGSALVAIHKDPAENKVIYRSWFFTFPLSPTRNRHYSYWGASSFLPRQIELLYRLGDTKFFQEVEKFNLVFDYFDGMYRKIPSNLAALQSVFVITGKVMSAIWQRFFYVDQWFLLFDLNNFAKGSFGKYEKVNPPKDRFWADPHIIHDRDRYYVFIEEFLHRTHKGHISVIEIDEQGKHTNPTRVLEKEYHLSYPFVFEWDGKYYMVPESAENHTIDLYECVEFPGKWRFKLTLMQNVTAVDTTLFHYLGKWWLFTAMAENENAFPQVELFLFHSDNLFTDKWKPHSLNPIVSDTKKARPAGKIFICDGKIYRPSQVCTSTYGNRIDINEILVLSENEYAEKEVISIDPLWNNKVTATHTYAREGQLVVIDAYQKREKFII